MIKPLNVYIKLSETGSGTVIINGVDFSYHIKNISFDAGMNKATSMTLELVNIDIKQELDK